MMAPYEETLCPEKFQIARPPLRILNDGSLRGDRGDNAESPEEIAEELADVMQATLALASEVYYSTGIDVTAVRVAKGEDKGDFEEFYVWRP